LTVNDLRQNAQEINSELLAGIMLISERLKRMNVFINTFTIPDDFIGDFNALTSNGYKLLFSMDSDISRQLDILEIFLKDKQNNSSVGGFHPKYIDLRINGRVYYK